MTSIIVAATLLSGGGFYAERDPASAVNGLRALDADVAAGPGGLVEVLVMGARGVSLIVAAVEVELRGQARIYDIVTRRSDDRGATWKDFARVLPVDRDTVRSLLAPRLASRGDALLVGWTEWIDNPSGTFPAYGPRASVSLDEGRSYEPEAEISPPTAFGARATLAAVGVTPEGFVAVVTDTEDFDAHAVTAYELSPPYEAWTQSFVFPDSSISLPNVDIVSAGNATYAAVGTAEHIAVCRRNADATWSRIAAPTTGVRAHDAQLAIGTDGSAVIAWTDRGLPALAYVRAAVGGPAGEWSDVVTFDAPGTEEYLLSRLVATTDGMYHLLLHRTPDRFGEAFDLIYFCSLDGTAWNEAAAPLNTPSRHVRWGTRADMIGGPSLAVVWEDEHFVSDAAVRFRTTADPAYVTTRPQELPLQPVPNPITSRGAIAFRSPAEGRATLRLFDLSGGQLGSWPLGRVEPATYTFDWDARTASGTAVGSGVYFWRVEVATADTVLTGGARVVVVR